MTTRIKAEAGTRALIAVEHEEMLNGYRLGRMCLLYGAWEGSVPGTTYVIDNLKWLAKRGMFNGKLDHELYWHIGFLLGMLSSGIPVQAGR
jgi:hypothetical protein